jgi:hypothetical protein
MPATGSPRHTHCLCPLSHRFHNPKRWRQSARYDLAWEGKATTTILIRRECASDLPPTLSRAMLVLRRTGCSPFLVPLGQTRE